MMNDATPSALPADAEESVLAPGRFWEHVLGGVVLAVVSFGVVLYSAYHGWIASDLSSDWAYAGVGFGFLFFALGAFVFAYGWTGGDMEKSLRLTFFVCVVCLAAIVGLLILLKSKGAGAKAAGEAGSAALSSDGFDVRPVVYAVASMFEDGSVVAGAAEPKVDPAETLFQIRCRGCGAKFAPTPPEARCPFCDEAALAG